MLWGVPLTIGHAQQFQYVCLLFVSHSRYIHLQVPTDKSGDLKLHSLLAPDFLAICSWRLSVPRVPFFLRCNSINSIPWALIGPLLRVKHSEWSRTKDQLRSLAVISPQEGSASFLSPGEPCPWRQRDQIWILLDSLFPLKWQLTSPDVHLVSAWFLCTCMCVHTTRCHHFI